LNRSRIPHTHRSACHSYFRRSPPASFLTQTKAPMKNTHWYCHECGDGPLVIAHSTGCPSCYHDKCASCQESFIDPKYPSYSIGTTQINANGASTTISAFPCAAGAAAVTTAPCSTRCNIRNTIVSDHSHGSIMAPTDGGEVVYRWSCCGCGGDNSYDYSPGCTDCNNHWRCGGCTVYGTEV
jgi:hypothetical protein